MSADPMLTTTPRPSKQRIDSIDVARGLAVILLFFNHAIVLLDASTPPWAMVLVYRASDFCIPMFMGISGLTMAYLLQRNPDRARATAHRYVGRAVTLFFGAHLLITIGIWPLYWNEHSFLTILALRWHITDAIAICLVLGPPLILRLGTGARLAIAVALPILSRAITAFWHPDVFVVAMAKELLFGIDDYDSAPAMLNVYPFGPYLSMFLVGTLLAPPLVRAITDGQPARFVRRLFLLSGGVFVLGVGTTALYVFVLRDTLDRELHRDWLGFFFPSKVSGLLPIYLAMGGALIALVIYRIECSRQYTWFDYACTVFGRTSLFSYITQYFLIQGAPACLGFVGAIPLAIFVPLIAVFTAIMFVAAHFYARRKQYINTGDFGAIRSRIALASVQRA